MEILTTDIIKKAAEGDVAAFEKIYKVHFHFVMRVALRMLNHWEDAQEVTQEVFITLYKKLSTFHFESVLKTWIYRITVNHVINYAKKRNREIKRQTELTEATGAKDDPSIGAEIEKQDTENVVQELLSHLNPDQKVCIILRSQEGLTYKEIAQALRIPINTVRSRLKRARETMMRLRKEVRKNEM